MQGSNKPLFAVVLLHGLAGPKDELAFIATKIRASFGSTVLIIEPHCRARYRSVCLSTNKQAEKVLLYIQSTLRKYQIEKSLPIVIIGYSHGGVLAVMLGKRYRDQLNIHGIAVINAPLTGVSLLTRSPREIKEFVSEAKECLKLIGYQPSLLYKTIVVSGIVPLLLPYLRPSFATAWPLYGLKDLHPESSCIETISDFLYGGAYGIPILMIATYQDDFRKLFDIRKPIEKHIENMIQLNHSYARYITGNPFHKHDTLIALPSQLCRRHVTTHAIDSRGNKSNDATAIPPTPMHHGNIKSKIYKDFIHAHNLIAINPFLFVAYGERVIHAHQIVADLISFIKKYIRK